MNSSVTLESWLSVRLSNPFLRSERERMILMLRVRAHWSSETDTKADASDLVLVSRPYSSLGGMLLAMAHFERIYL